MHERQIPPVLSVETTAYSDTYKEECFLSWYNANRPRGKVLMNTLPKDTFGRIPNQTLVMTWKRELEWEKRADEMDEEARKRASDLAIQRKVEMLQHHAEVGQNLTDLGMNYFLNHPLDKPGDALKAIDLGTRLERSSTGGAQALKELAAMNDTSLLREIQKLQGKATGAELSELDGSDIIDGEVDEVP